MKNFIETHKADFSKIRPLTNNRVYILTGDPESTYQLVKQLGAENFQLKPFTDVTGLVALSQKVSPAAILVDNDDPITGSPDFEAIKHLKKYLHPCPPILCLSSAADITNRLAAARAGSTRYFSKPISLGTLFRSLRGFGAAEDKIKPYRVLLIDDDDDLLTLFSSQLSRAGIEVKTLSDPQQSLNTLNSFEPDLLLLDVHMPGISGAELTQIIRQDDDFAQLPIIYLSMDDSPEHQQALIELGGDEFLSKQTDAKRLVARVNEQIKRARESVRINQGLRDALWDSELRRFALDNHAIVSATDVNGKITYVNDTFCKISGYHRDELLGKNHRILKSGKHSDKFYTNMWVDITQGKTWQGTICNRRKDGSEYWVESTIVPFLDNEGLPYQYVSVRTDITALRASEDRLHRSQVFANIGTWDWNIKTGELYWSERIAPLFGYSESLPETTYDNFLAAIHPEDRQSVITAVHRCIELGEDYNIEHRIVWPDESVHWVTERGDVVRDEHGNPLHMLGVVQDITQRKLVESELRKHKISMDSSLEGIAIIDAFGKYRYLNPAMATIYGFQEPDELLGHFWTEHYDSEELTQFEEETMPQLITKHQWSGETTGHRKDGSSFPQQLSLSTLADGDLVCIVHDISNRKQAEADLISAKESAELASQAKSQFLSSMSHELRTPMNAIIGFSQLLQMEPLNEIQQDNVSEIVKAGNHLLELINEVLDLSRVEEGRLDLTIEAVEFQSVLLECLALISPLAEQRGITIITQHEGKEINVEQESQFGIILYADRTRLKQALINLLSNAVKYNHENGQVTINCQPVDDKHLRISIIDTGPGITDEQQLQLFQPFNRLGAENTETEGTGIGLVYTKKIVELMSGNMDMQSTLQKGSTFWIDLPGYFLSSRNIKIENETENALHKNTSNTENKTQDQFTVLYVEDNPANMRLMEQMLMRRSDIQLVKAHEPLLGLELAAHYQPDLILLDINLPGMSGYDVLQILRENSEAQEIPIVAISANAMPEDIQKGLDAGFSHYITKPIKLPELFDAIDNILIKNTAEQYSG